MIRRTLLLTMACGLAHASVLVLTATAHAAPKKAVAKKPEPADKPAVEKPASDKPPDKEEASGDPNYVAYGARGGATFGGRSGLRALFFGGTHFFNDGYGFLGIEAAYIHGFSRDFEMGFGVRFSTWPQGIARGVNAGYGFAPGIDVKWRLVDSGSFHLAIAASALAAITPVGMFGGMTIGMTVEPAVLVSYFIRDNMELFGGFYIPVTPLFLPVPLVQIAFSPRVGFAYTLKSSGIGFFAAFDISPGFFAYGGFPTIENNLANPVVKPTFRVAINTNLGVQVRF